MDYYDQQEAQAEASCLHTAQKNGHTGAEAQLCDDGSVGCPDCPFVRVLTSRALDGACTCTLLSVMGGEMWRRDKFCPIESHRQ